MCQTQAPPKCAHAKTHENRPVPNLPAMGKGRRGLPFRQLGNSATGAPPPQVSFRTIRTIFSIPPPNNVVAISQFGDNRCREWCGCAAARASHQLPTGSCPSACMPRSAQSGGWWPRIWCAAHRSNAFSHSQLITVNVELAAASPVCTGSLPLWPTLWHTSVPIYSVRCSALGCSCWAAGCHPLQPVCLQQWRSSLAGACRVTPQRHSTLVPPFLVALVSSHAFRSSPSARGRCVC